MKLCEILANTAPEVAATYDLKVAVNWTTKKAKLVIVGYDNQITGNVVGFRPIVGYLRKKSLGA